MSSLATRLTNRVSDDLHRRFLTILPRIETHARIFFRFEACLHKRADRVSEVVALAWKSFVRLHARGKDATRFASQLAKFATMAVNNGRQLCGQLKSKETMNEIAQGQHGFSVSKLPDYSTLSTNPFVEALQDNTRTPPPDAAAFRIDWPAWLRTRTGRDRRIIRDMALSERTKALARRHGVSPGRISQLRREYCQDWKRFCDEGEPGPNH